MPTIPLPVKALLKKYLVEIIFGPTPIHAVSMVPDVHLSVQVCHPYDVQDVARGTIPRCKFGAIIKTVIMDTVEYAWRRYIPVLYRLREVVR